MRREINRDFGTNALAVLFLLVIVMILFLGIAKATGLMFWSAISTLFHR